jgi:hypothetical protein
MTKRHLAEPTPGPWLVVREDAEHAIISNTLDRSWNQIEHYVGRVRANNAPLIIAARDLIDVLQEICALAALGRDERGASKIIIAPELYDELEAVLATMNGNIQNHTRKGRP